MYDFEKDWQDKVDHVAKLTDEGNLTVGDLLMPGFYRLREGEHGNRVIIYSISFKVDNKPALLFAKSMSWIWKSKLDHIKCEPVTPKFNEAIHPVEKLHWYSDAGTGPHFYDW